MPRIDLNIDLDINYVCKLTKFIIELNRKIYKLKTYNIVINNPISRNKCYKAIDKKL